MLKRTEKATSIPATQSVTNLPPGSTEESVATQTEKTKKQHGFFANVSSERETTASNWRKELHIGINQSPNMVSLKLPKDYRRAASKAGEGKNLTIEYKCQTDIGMRTRLPRIVSKKVDILCGLATPRAQACYNAHPGMHTVIYTAVTSPKQLDWRMRMAPTPEKSPATSDLLPAKDS